MSRVATNYPTTHFNNGFGPSSTTFLNRSSSNASATNGRTVTVRSAAPPPAQKETVHACPLCNGPYKDPRVLPCTHTYCLNCIREKLIQNDCVTCPKCHHQVHPFDESDLNDLQRNLILSQEWRLNTRPAVPASPITKKLVVPPSNLPTAMPKQQEKRKSVTSESNGHDSTHSRSGLSALVHAFNKSAGSASNSAGRGSRSSSVSNAPSNVPNLVKIYSEVTTPRQEQQITQQQKPRSDSVMSTGKHDELTRIFEQATNRSQRPSTSAGSAIQRPSTGSAAQRPSQAYEEISWDNLVHGAPPPVAPPMPNQWKTATEHDRDSLEVPDRPASASSRNEQVHIDNLRDVISSIHQHIPDKTTLSIPRGPILDSKLNSRPSTGSHRRIDSDLDDDDDDDEDDLPPTPIQQSAVYATILPPPLQQPAQHSRQNSYAESIRTITSTSTSRHSPAPSMTKNNAQRTSITSAQQQQGERTSQRAPSVNLSNRRSSDRFPSPPPSHVESLDLTGGGGSIHKPRSTSTLSSRSSAYVDANETNFLSTERFNPDTDIPAPVRTNNSSRAHSQIGSRSTTPTNRPGSKSSERETRPIIPTASPSSTVAVTSRVDHLLSDQKRLEREIDEQIKRLKHDYDDVRKQIDRKESSIHNEVRNIAAHLDEDITEHYQRKQQIYAELAANNNSVGSELERLKTSSNTTANTQQLWNNLEQIEVNIHNIRRAVEQQKEPQGALTFSEGRRTLGTETIGQLTLNPLDSRRRHHSPSQPPTSSREQTSTNITPYKYLKIDHLAALEPEAIAITPDDSRILLGICNKLFILDEYGTPVKVVPLTPSIRGIAVSKKHGLKNIAYISHDETVSIINIDTGETLDCVKETDSTGQSGTFLPLGIDTDHIRGDVYVCDYRNSCVIKFDEKLEFLTQWRIFNHSTQYDEARPKLISVHGERFYMIVEHSCKPYYNQGIAYTFSLHICDTNSGTIIKIIDADLLGPQRLRWPCSVQAINNDKCYILDTMTSGKYFNGQWQKHWSRVLEIGQDDSHIITELFQLDSEAATMAMTKKNMIIAANGDILFVDLAFLHQDNTSEHEYQNLP